MVNELILLLVAVIVVGLLAALAFIAIDAIPIDARFKQIGRVLVMVIAVLVILRQALPLLGIAV